MDLYEKKSHIRPDESPGTFLSDICNIGVYRYSDEDAVNLWASEFKTKLKFQFEERLEKEWEERKHVLRYQIGDIKTKIVGEELYVVELNPDRITNRRPRQVMSSVKMPFDKNSFHFAQVPLQEVMFLIDNKDWPRLLSEKWDPERYYMAKGKHAVIVNTSPISKNHCLFCPFVDQLLPQVLTQEALILALEVMMIIRNRDYRMAFNSLGAHASVNNLHFHIYELNHRLLIERAPLVPLAKRAKNIFIFKNLPPTAFVFVMCRKDIRICHVSRSTYYRTAKHVMVLINYLHKENIAYNIYITRGKPAHDPSDECENCIGDAIRICVWPRKTILEEKNEMVTVASLELAGHFIFGDEHSWNRASNSYLLLRANEAQVHPVYWNIQEDVIFLYFREYWICHKDCHFLLT